MPTTRYTVMNGEIVSENRAGVLRDYVSDPQGSTIALLDENQNQTDQWTYAPFGEATRIMGSTPTPMLFVGNKSCRQDGTGTRNYMRHRVLDVPKARWMTEDPLAMRSNNATIQESTANSHSRITVNEPAIAGWFMSIPTKQRYRELNRYIYASNNPTTATDPSGLFSCWWCLVAGLLGSETEILCQVLCHMSHHQPSCSPKAQPGPCPNATPCTESDWRYCRSRCYPMKAIDCLHGCFGWKPLCMCEDTGLNNVHLVALPVAVESRPAF